MALRLPIKSGPDEVVEFFVCPNPACRSHVAQQPAAIIKWSGDETSRKAPCGYCYHETVEPPVIEYEAGIKNGEVVQIPKTIIKEAVVVPNGAMLTCVRGQGAAEVKRDSLTYEILEILRQS